jgi:hypothetical protein
MQSRISNPVLSVPGVLDSLQSLSKAADDAASRAGLPHGTIELVNLRASQINGCLAGRPVLHRCRAGRTGPGRGGDQTG